MSIIANALNGGAAQGQSSSQSKTEKGAASAASDFNNFLKLLTAQLRNQDPLSPLDSTQFVQQLASFSAVEQQIETNRLLERLNGKLSASGLETATSWIGKDVEAPIDSARYKGEALNFTLPSGVSGELVIRDATGEVVRRAPIEAGQNEYRWNGKTDAGANAPHGDYRVQIEAKNVDGAVVTSPVSAVARVVEARVIDGAVRLILENGVAVAPEAVASVRAPKASAAADSPAAPSAPDAAQALEEALSDVLPGDI